VISVNHPAQGFHLVGMATFPVSLNEKGWKIPSVSGWQKLSSSSPPTTAANWGIAISDDFIVIDVDIKNGKRGQDSFNRMLDLLPRPLLSMQYRVQTMSGGWHYWFKKPPELKTRKHNPNYPDIDFLSRGEMAIGEGTDFRVPGKEAYKVVQGQFNPSDSISFSVHVPDFPEEWYPIVEQAEREEKPDDYDFRDDQVAINSYIQDLKTYPEAIANKNGNDTTYLAACKGRDFGLNEETTLSILLEHYNPRCQPQWDELELNGIVYNAYRYATGQVGKDNYRNRLLELPDDTEHLPIVSATPNRKGLNVYTAQSLMTKVFPPLNYVVPGLMTEGLALLVGAPKTGKSWMALSLAVAVATGGLAINGEATEQGQVLYLALEDSERRLKARLSRLQLEEIPADLYISNQSSQATIGGLDDLIAWLDQHSRCRLVIVDTLQRFRTFSSRESYASDYASLIPLQELAIQRGITILMVHHTRKSTESTDPFDRVSGTTAITGAADCTWILSRDRNDDEGRLNITGRDIEEKELILSFQTLTCQWRVVGEAEEIDGSDEEHDVINTIKVCGPVTAKDLTSKLGLTGPAARKRLSRMNRKRKLLKLENGSYGLPEAEFQQASTAS
jgi:archaellum biogenesis ATPase FlaH